MILCPSQFSTTLDAETEMQIPEPAATPARLLVRVYVPPKVIEQQLEMLEVQVTPPPLAKENPTRTTRTKNNNLRYTKIVKHNIDL